VYRCVVTDTKNNAPINTALLATTSEKKRFGITRAHTTKSGNAGNKNRAPDTCRAFIAVTTTKAIPNDNHTGFSF
jgi:hypothetical protein